MHPLPDTLRILAFCDYYSSTSTGGSERVAREVYRRLAAQGHAVRVLTAAAGDAPSDHGVEVVSVHPIDLSSILGAQVALAPGMSRLARRSIAEFRPDVIQAHSLHFRGSAVAARLARDTGLPLVTVAHVGSLAHLPPHVRAATSLYERWVGRRILRSSTRAVAVSRDVADHVRRLAPSDVSIDLVPNGVDHTRFGVPEPSCRRANEILFVGRLIGNKNPGLLLAAVGALIQRGDELTLTYVGDGPLASKLERTARRLGVHRRVEFVGRTDDVERYLHRASILVRPSSTEGMSLALLEAMAAGCCIVASDIPANRELVEHEETGLLVETGDQTALEEAIGRLAANPALIARLSTNAQRASRGYSWDRTAEGHLAALVDATREQA